MAGLEPILVVGGGIAGLGLATALRRRGLAAELVERGPAWPTTGAAITMHANGVRALRALGVGPAIDAASAVLPRWTFYDSDGRQLCDTDLVDLWGAVGPCLGITRRRLQDALLDGTAGVPARLGLGVVDVADGPDGVRVGFADGSQRTYGLVVGADGIGSTIRQCLFGASPARYAGTTGWRSVIPTRPEGVTHLQLYMGEGRFFGVVPVGDAGTYGFAGVGTEPADEPMTGRLEKFRELFADFAGPVPEYLAGLRRDEDLHATRVGWVELETWHTARVVLIGDAAHAAPPHMGEGGSLALEDALALADLLAAGDEGNVLATFEERRRPRVEWVQEQSRIAERAFLLPPQSRNAALRERGDEMLRARYRPLIPEP